ncbi:MAG: mycofactocin-associated electron transfer flavoprotein alpha subunit [Acidimicrobiales bacterium]
MIAVVPVRGGELPLGADEAVAEAGGACMVVGDDTKAAASELQAAATVTCVELGDFAPATWAHSLAPHLADDPVVILPASPDGRDLAPRLAYALGRPLLAGAVDIRPTRVVLVRRGGLVQEDHEIDGPFVATLEPGGRGAEARDDAPEITELIVEVVDRADPRVLEVLAPDPATMDLAEARRIIAGGAGLGGPEPFDHLRACAAAIGASWGASRVAADLGWVPQDRFIGTTGVTVDARLYVALGISGAVQHVTGLGHPDHIIAVNVDASAPMMAMADLAIVADARAVLTELAARLGVGT